MQKTYIIALGLAVLSMAACKNNKTGPAVESFNSQPTAQPTQIIQTKTDSAGINSPQQTLNQVSAGLNPAHGQPGHRCEIPVGAPLNSAPGAGASQQVTITQPTATTKPTNTLTTPVNSLPQAKNVKLNPAHGQPGHNCAVAVGQPLPQ